MPDLDEKLKRFTEAITSDAAADSYAIMEEVRRQRESSQRSAVDDSLEAAYRYIKAEVTRIRTESGRTVSRRMMDNKRTLYARRAELSGEVLRDVMQKLADYVTGPAYAEQLTGMARQAAGAFGGAPTVISLRREDMTRIPTLRKAVEGRDVTFVEGTFRLGGLTAECPGQQRQINMTFDANLAEWRERFFAEIVIS